MEKTLISRFRWNMGIFPWNLSSGIGRIKAERLIERDIWGVITRGKIALRNLIREKERGRKRVLLTPMDTADKNIPGIYDERASESRKKPRFSSDISSTPYIYIPPSVGRSVLINTLALYILPWAEWLKQRIAPLCSSHRRRPFRTVAQPVG